MIYEAGIADALGRSRTVIVEFGLLRPLSDLAGRSVVRFDGTVSARLALASRLGAAGLKVNTRGGDWPHEGDFLGALKAAADALAGQRALLGLPPLAEP